MLNLAADGTFSAWWTNIHSTPISIWAYEGTWTVTDGVCETILTKSLSWGTTNHQVEGAIDRWLIVSVDHHQLVWTWEKNNQTNSLIRRP